MIKILIAFELIENLLACRFVAVKRCVKYQKSKCMRYKKVAAE